MNRTTIKRLWRRVPIFGGLVDARTNDHFEAFTEIALNVGFSTVPIWFGAFIMLAGKDTKDTWFTLILDNVRTGELWLYATAMLSPLYYFIFKNYRSAKVFPSGRSFMVIGALILIFASGLFAVQRAERASLIGSFLNHDFVFDLSWKGYLFSVGLVYLAHVYRNFLETGAATLTGTDTQEFVEDFLSERRDK